jgi:hypothetical protein
MANLIHTSKEFQIQLKETNDLITEIQEYINSAQKFLKQINVSDVDTNKTTDGKNKKTLNEKTNDDLNGDNDDNDEEYFSRIEPPYTSVCNFSNECNKNAAFYRDSDNVYYCWFHLQSCGCKIR